MHHAVFFPLTASAALGPLAGPAVFRRLWSGLAGLCLALLWGLACAWPALAQAADPPGVATHRLSVSLDQAQGTLRLIDAMGIPPGLRDPLRLRLAEHAVLDTLELDGAILDVRAHKGVIELPASLGAHGAVLRLAMTARFPTAPASAPMGNDNPGFAGEAVINAQGAMLLPGSRWHPFLEGVDNSFDLTVEAQTGFTAVGPGRFEDRDDDGERARTRLTVAAAPRPMYLVVGPYTRGFTARDGGVRVESYLTAQNAFLGETYLVASSRWIDFYARLHGPYAFPGFAVIENFLPTGYGLPGATLLGGEVIRLPFIPATSLRHEVAHNWWGNGVLVDYGQGNWSEGLTTYVADYLGREEAGPAEAREYRLSVLRDFSELAADAPLTLRRFESRVDAASQAVGYGKCMMLFHMLRRRVGDEDFYATLAALYRDNLGRALSFHGIARAFDRPRMGALNPSLLVAAMVDRPRGPQLALGEVRREGNEILVTVSQKEPAWPLRVPLRLTTVAGEVSWGEMDISGGTGQVYVAAPDPVRRIEIDPEAEVFRLLSAQEIPASMNALKAVRSGFAVVVAKGFEAYAEAARLALSGMSRGPVSVVSEDEAVRQLSKLAKADLVFVGLPGAPELSGLAGRLPAGLERDGDSLRLGPDVARAEEPDILCGIIRTETGQTRLVVSPRLGAEPGQAARALAKLTHYGKYGLLGFKGERNVLKMVFEPAEFPLSRVFEGPGL